MAKFLFVYRHGVNQMNHQPSPEEMQAVMAQWGEWFQTMGTAVVDGGDGLLPTGRQVAASGAVSDGPFIEARELVGGFTIIQADSCEGAVEYAQTCPVIAEGGTVEVRQLAGYGENVSD
ncbi:MAG: YciI family protein [Planctomycetaceae bacterium]